MKARMETFGSREEWLAARGNSIGGSDIAAVIGISPWMSNTDLFFLKTGKIKRPEETPNALIEYGQRAEEHLRELFQLDFPEYKVLYVPNNLWRNSEMPYAHVSLDSWLIDENGRFGVLEIKTATIQSGRQKEKWNEGVPNHYYAQVLWEMAVTEAEFGILVAQLKYERDDDVLKVTRHYKVTREQARADIRRLKEAGEAFWKCVEEGVAPATILPSI